MDDGKQASKLEIGVSQGSTNSLGGMTRRLSMKIAKIKNVHPESNTVDLEWLWPIRGGADQVPISRPYVGFRSGIHFVPEVGSIVVIGYAFNQMVMLSYLLPSDYSKLIDGNATPSGAPSYIRQMAVGEVSMRSIQGSEVYLHDQVTIQDKNLDSIVIDPDDGSITLDSLILYANNEAGNITMGPVIRTVDGVDKIITNDGSDVTSSVGGKALTEFTLTVNQYADATVFDGVPDSEIAKISIGTLVDDSGKKVLNQAGNQIVCNIALTSGAKVQIDSKGNVNINEGNMLRPTAQPVVADNLSSASTVKFVNTAQQRAAREGDRIVIPMTTPTTSAKDHPDLTTKSTFNILQMQQVASMLMTPYGPCIGFLASVPDTRLVGEITQGSDSVFIGSLDKAAESKETLDNSL